ncbi:cobalamin-dependent protein [Haliangium sp.]|uniref:cobalamin-dependent protein n=1 Tax=Haliangium sp. TaxID=2663208 RepID=UPI003D0EFA5A
MTPNLKVTLIHHPTVALRVFGFGDDFPTFQESGIFLGNVYRRIIPQSLARVASVIERDLPNAEVDILDLRILDPDREEPDQRIDWDGYVVETRRVGAAFSRANDAIAGSDWIGLSSHFTFESGVVAKLIAHAKRLKPSVKVMVGGADVKARPEAYLAMGADLAFRGDFDPHCLRDLSSSPRPSPRIVDEYRYPFEPLSAPAFHKLPHLQQYTDSHDGPVPTNVSHPVAFAHFTRGCPRECDFCESRRTKFEMLPLDACIAMLEHYKCAGIRTINFADDNLLLRAARPEWREEFLQFFQILRELEFAWEFPNGLEVGRFATEGGLDEELLEAMFNRTYHPETGQLIGAYRVYTPIETFDKRSLLRKLKPLEDQHRVLRWFAHSGLPQINFGVIVPPEATAATFRSIEDGYRAIRDIFASSTTEARYGLFHLIPIALFRSMATKYSVHDFPEGWNFYFPVYDGQHFSARVLFENRLRVMREIDPASYDSLRYGRYAYQ